MSEDGLPPSAVYRTDPGNTAWPISTVSLQHGAEEVILRVWGDFAHRTHAETLFRILIRLLARTHPTRLHRPGDHPAHAGPPGLRLPADYVVGGSAAVAALHEQLAPLTQGDLPVLLVGETGTGKEYVARILHQSTRGRSGPFAALNCAAIPADLLEAELFGIGKGVATGVRAREGRFRQARGGTLFLDEIGEMPLAFQPKLLRALQERSIQPLGGRETPIDVRILAATNVDLAARAADGTFRSDLYYRLAGAVIQLPALRQRREDIPALVEHAMRETCDAIAKPIRGISVKALDALCAYAWPGNIRELKNEVRRLVYACPVGGAIESSMIAPAILRGNVAPPGQLEAFLRKTPDLHLDRLERAVVEEALRRTDGNQVQAGKLLGVSRTAVRRRLARYDQV